MKQKSIELLNKAVGDELTAIHQYLYFHFHCDDQGLEILANLFKRTAIEEMKHVEKLADRILFLKGDVVMKAGHDVQPIKVPKEMLALAAKMEENGVKDYNLCANECGASADAVSRKLFEELAADEEQHFNQYDNEMGNLRKFGDQYLALQSMERSKKISN
jgi:bacterioferritin